MGLFHLSRQRSRRSFAPFEDASTLTRYTPTQTLKRFTATTRGDYDLLISLHENNVAGYYQSMSEILLDMQQLLQAMGIDLDADQIEVWLSSVVGDDVISMSVVFNSLKQVTQNGSHQIWAVFAPVKSDNTRSYFFSAALISQRFKVAASKLPQINVSTIVARKRGQVLLFATLLTREYCEPSSHEIP